VKYYEINIGIEAHVEIKTSSKLFCSCLSAYGGQPNSRCCPVCTGMPGALPILNQKALEAGIKIGISLKSSISRVTDFDRKHYFYPDLPKGYQITQFYHPLCTGGYVNISMEDGSTKRIRLKQIHIEEDSGKLVTDKNCGRTLVDYNRSGIPLLEIVSMPDLSSADEAVEYLKKLKKILVGLGISDCEMNKGSYRADINISVKKPGDVLSETKTEIKNLNSFKAIKEALALEAEMLKTATIRGDIISSITKRWDEDKETLIHMRQKENNADYRYIHEPDIPAVEISQDVVDWIAKQLSELPEDKKNRYISDFGLSAEQAEEISSDPYVSKLFSVTSQSLKRMDASDIYNWITGPVYSQINRLGREKVEMNLTADKFNKTIYLYSQGRINRMTAEKVLREISDKGADPVSTIGDKDMEVITDRNILRDAVKKVISKEEDAVQEYLNGKEKVIQYLTGRCMKETGGRSDPEELISILLDELVN